MRRLPLALLMAACAAALSACASVSTMQSPSAELGERALRLFASDCSQLRTKLDSLDQAVNGLRAEARELPWEDKYLTQRKELWAKTDYYEQHAESELRRALEENPTCEIPYLRLGDKAAASVHFSDVQAAVAENYYQYGLKLRPYHPGLLARAAWMRELIGDFDSARVLYQQAGVVEELEIDGNLEAARLALRNGLLERFKAAGDDAYVEMAFRFDHSQRKVPDWVRNDTVYVRLHASGRCEYSIAQHGRGEMVKGLRFLPGPLQDSVLMHLEHADVLRFRNILDSSGNYYEHYLAFHATTTVVKLHLPGLEHVVSVYALAPGYGDNIHRYGTELGLAERLNSLGEVKDLLTSTSWITRLLDSAYGRHRSLHSRDGLARYDSATGLITGVRLPDFGVAWRATAGAVPTPVGRSENSVCVFDFGIRVVGFAEAGGSEVFNLPIDKETWPYVSAPPYRDVLYFVRRRDSAAVVRVYDAAKGTLMLEGEITAAGEVQVLADAIGLDRMNRRERKRQLDLMVDAAEEYIREGIGNRPAMQELDYKHW